MPTADPWGGHSRGGSLLEGEFPEQSLLGLLQCGEDFPAMWAASWRWGRRPGVLGPFFPSIGSLEHSHPVYEERQHIYSTRLLPPLHREAWCPREQRRCWLRARQGVEEPNRWWLAFRWPPGRVRSTPGPSPTQPTPGLLFPRRSHQDPRWGLLQPGPGLRPTFSEVPPSPFSGALG